MMECMRLITDEVGTREREREREGLKIGRSGRSRTIWADRNAGDEMGAAALLLTPPTPEGRDPPSLRPKPNPKN